MAAVALLDEIDVRSGAETTQKLDSRRKDPLTTTRPWRIRTALLATGFVLVLIAGISAGWLTRGEEPVDVATPVSLLTANPSGVGDGQTVGVTVSGVSGHGGDDLAGVLYAGDELTDLNRDAVGGFWSVISGDDFTTTEVVREPAELGVERFPFVSDEALIVEPGMYTLVVWVDDRLNPVSRWVPLNTDGMGLFSCQHVFEVGGDGQTDVAVSVELQPDGWNTNCTTG